MPLPNFHGCRLRAPEDFQTGTFVEQTRKHDGKSYQVRLAKLKGETVLSEQSFLYPKTDWTAAQARAHCKNHKGILFEPAGEAKSEDVTMDTEERAVWSTTYINNLADDCFLYIEAGGKKDGDGKTVPRTLRHFPYRDASGKIDQAHLKNALSRIPQSSLPQAVKDSVAKKAQKLYDDNFGAKKSDEPEGLERRWVTFDQAEVRVSDDGTPRLIGYGAVFNSRTDIGWFTEQVASGCFTDTIQTDDIRGLFNHDPSLILGRNKAKPTPTMRLSEDAKGLRFEIDVADTQVGRDVVTSVKRGDVSGCSFSFLVLRDEWDRTDPDKPFRTLRSVKLFDVGPVTFPAYPDTSVAARSLEAFQGTQKPDEMASETPAEPEKPGQNGPKRAENEPKTVQKDQEASQNQPVTQSDLRFLYDKAGRILNEIARRRS